MALIRVEEISKFVGQEATIQGWVYNRTDKGKLVFLLVRDGSGFVQCVAFKGDLDEAVFDQLIRLPQESAVIITGPVREDKRAPGIPGGYEIGVKEIEIVQAADADYPMALKDHGVDFADRRGLAEEKVRCMQALWADDEAEYHGDRVDLPPSFSWPKPVQRAGSGTGGTGRPGVPVLVGGGPTPSVFDAVVGYGCGWMPIGGSGIGGALPELERRWAGAGRDGARPRVLPFGTVPTTEKLEYFAEIGIEEVVLRLPSGGRDVMMAALDELATFVERFDDDRAPLWEGAER